MGPRHKAEDDTWRGEPRAPRGRDPEGMAKSEGARAPKRCDPVATEGSLVMAEPCFAWTPARGSSRAEGAKHIASGPYDPTRAPSRPGYRRSGTAGGCARLVLAERVGSAAARRAAVRLVAEGAQPQVALAQDLRESVLTTDRANGARRPHLGTAPRLASDAQACRVPRVAGMGAGYKTAERWGLLPLPASAGRGLG